MIFFYFIIGLVLVVKGGDIFVDSASFIAEKTGIPKFIVGATIVSFATTFPELLVSVFATLNGSIDIGVGNAVGSVICNMALIMGISILFLPSIIKRSDILEKSFLMILSTALLWACLLNQRLSLAECIVFLLIFIYYLYLNIKTSNDKSSYSIPINTSNAQNLSYITKFILGALCVVIGSWLMVNNGEIIARNLGVPENIIGLTLMAIGTSLPELVTTITAIKKGESAMSIGNIIGANIMDILLIIPICSLISSNTLLAPMQTITLDLPITLFFMVIAIVPTLICKKFSRWQGVILVSGYVLYILSLI